MAKNINTPTFEQIIWISPEDTNITNTTNTKKISGRRFSKITLKLLSAVLWSRPKDINPQNETERQVPITHSEFDNWLFV